MKGSTLSTGEKCRYTNSYSWVLGPNSKRTTVLLFIDVFSWLDSGSRKSPVDTPKRTPCPWVVFVIKGVRMVAIFTFVIRLLDLRSNHSTVISSLWWWTVDTPEFVQWTGETGSPRGIYIVNGSTASPISYSIPYLSLINHCSHE